MAFYTCFIGVFGQGWDIVIVRRQWMGRCYSQYVIHSDSSLHQPSTLVLAFSLARELAIFDRTRDERVRMLYARSPGREEENRRRR